MLLNRFDVKLCKNFIGVNMSLNPCSLVIGQNLTKNIPVECKSVDNALPKDLFAFALTYVPLADRPVAKGVSKSWDSAVLAGTKEQESVLLRAFDSSLIEKLATKYPDITTKISELIKTNKIPSAKDLNEIQSELLDLRDKIVAILTSVEDEDLIFLMDLPVSPLFFDQICYLVDVEKRLVADKSEGNILKIAEEVCEKGFTEKSIGIVTKCPGQVSPNMSQSVKKMAMKLCEKGQEDSAFKMLQTIAKSQGRSVGTNRLDPALVVVVQKICELGRIDLGNQLKDYITNPFKCQNASKMIVECIYQQNRFDEFILPTLNTPKFKLGDFLHYLEVLVVNKKFDEAIQLVGLIENSSVINESSKILAMSLSDIQEFDRATEVANKLPDDLKNPALAYIAVGAIAAGNFEKAILITADLPEVFKKKWSKSLSVTQLVLEVWKALECVDTDLDKAFMKIAEANCRFEFDLVCKLIPMITNEKLRDVTWSLVAEKLQKAGHSEHAKIALEKNSTAESKVCELSTFDVSTINTPEFKIGDFLAYLDSLFKEGQSGLAYQLIAKIENEELRNEIENELLYM